ncbi:MAG: YggS family pyridoxal phosphate enzyme [Lentisphaerae bacterium GWF2_45_14]|nr:MAG: YggS family pyridoxal phosphate enzyme [Lentisphaerae bacterium GWF2_45_14]
MHFDYVKQQLAQVREAVASAALKSGRKADDVKLLAVSKTFPNEAVIAAYEAGQRLFGENKVQELELKAPVLPSDIAWHLIGHLQSNKVLKAVTLASSIHSVDSLRLLQRIDRLAGENNCKPEILLEFNISGEESKFGASAEKDAMLLAAEAVKCANLSFRGLMTMAPLEADEQALRNIFSNLRKLRDLMEAEFVVKLPELSMGMSGDYAVAVEEGSTLVRIGTAIFGRRNYAV